MFNDVFRVCSQGVLLLSGVCGLEACLWFYVVRVRERSRRPLWLCRLDLWQTCLSGHVCWYFRVVLSSPVVGFVRPPILVMRHVVPSHVISRRARSSYIPF